MAVDDKIFDHYNCTHRAAGSWVMRGVNLAGPIPTNSADHTSQPPRVGEIRADDTHIYRWNNAGTAWVRSAAMAAF